MKNRLPILLIANVINLSVNAQTKNDSLLAFNNEIGINLFPFVMKSNMNYNDNAIFNIFYKRNIIKNWFGRASLIIFNNKNNRNNNLITIKGLPNSKLSFQNNQNNPNQYLQYNLGIEKRFDKTNVKLFTGLDFGFSHYQTESSEKYGLRDSLTNNYSAIYYYQNTLLNYRDSTIF